MKMRIIIVKLMFVRAVFIITMTNTVAASGSANIITVPPVDTIGCYGEISTFFCKSDLNDVVINWNINSNIITEQDKETHGITINNDSLVILGSPINNNIRIGCTIAVNTPPFLDSKSATFTVTDPSPIYNLTVQFNNDIMTSTWSQPSCVPVNHSYHVNINNESLIVTNTTTIQYTVTSCQSYNVSVTVMDTTQPQYQSETVTRTVNTGFILGDIQEPIRSMVTFNTAEECNVMVPLNIDVTLCDQIKLSETQTQPPTEKITQENITLAERLVSSDNNTGIGMFRFGPYSNRLKGNCKLSLYTISETANTLTFNISTFNVQNISTTPLSNGTTNITCVFANNSFADGCNVEFRNVTNHITIISIVKSDDEDTATKNVIIYNGEYDFAVYDIVGGVIDSNTAYTESDVITITHYQTSITDSSTTASTPSTTTTSLSSSISSSTEPTVAATNPVTNTGGSLDYIIIGCSISGVILVLVIVIVTGLIIFRIKCVRYEDGKHSLRVHSEQALVRKPRANQHNYADPVTILSIRTPIHNNEETEYLQYPSTFLQGAHNNSTPPPPPTYPPPGYNQNETEFTHPYTVTEDIHESSTSNEYTGRTTFVSREPFLPTQDTSTANRSTDNSYSQTRSSVISNDTQQQLTMDQIMDEINEYNFEQRSNEPNILKPPTVTSLSKPTVGVPEGPKLQESHYAELKLEGYQRPFQRIPEDPVAYASVAKMVVNTLPPIPPKPQQQQSIDIVQKTYKGHCNVIQYTNNDDGNDYTTVPVAVSDTESDHPSTFLQGALRNSTPPPPPTYPPQINEPTHDTSTTNGSTDNSSIPTESIPTLSKSSEISNGINEQLVLEAVNEYNSEERSNETNILKPRNVPVTPSPKPTVTVPEGPKLQESHSAELQLEYQRPFQRIPEDPVAYSSVTKKVESSSSTAPLLPPRSSTQTRELHSDDLLEPLKEETDKDPSIPPLPPKQQNTTNHLKKSLKVYNNGQEAFKETQQENSRVYVSSVSVTTEQYGAIVPSGSNEVIDITDYNYTSRNTENGIYGDQQYYMARQDLRNCTDIEPANCLEVSSTDCFFGAMNVFQSSGGNTDYGRYSENSCCDNEQIDDGNSNDDILSEMVYARTTFHCDVIVSSHRVDHSIKISDVINFDAQAIVEEVDTNIKDEIKEKSIYFSMRVNIAVESYHIKSQSVSVDPCTTLLPVICDGVLPTLKNFCATDSLLQFEDLVKHRWRYSLKIGSQA